MLSKDDYDGRGNVDRDSDEEDGKGEEPEAFQPQYESLPALRPAAPPQYKPSPAYGAQTGLHDPPTQLVIYTACVVCLTLSVNV